MSLRTGIRVYLTLSALCPHLRPTKLVLLVSQASHPDRQYLGVFQISHLTEMDSAPLAIVMTDPMRSMTIISSLMTTYRGCMARTLSPLALNICGRTSIRWAISFPVEFLFFNPMPLNHPLSQVAMPLPNSC